MLFGVTTTVSLLGLIYFFTALLIRRLAEARKQIELIAITDDLTGLYNRRHVLSRFKEEFEKVKRLNTSALLHHRRYRPFQVRQRPLRPSDRRRGAEGRGPAVLKSIVRAYDIVGRYGGEEFLVILPDTRLEDARHLAERMRLRIKEEVTSPDLLRSAWASPLDPADEHVLDDIIRRADTQLYRAKNAGRDRVM